MEWKETLTPQEFFKLSYEIYNRLEDEASKKLYHKRMLFSINQFKDHSLFTKNTVEVERIKNQIEPYYNKIKNITPHEPICFYGIGALCKKIMEHFGFTAKQYPNIIFCDKMGESLDDYLGFPIITPQQLLQQYQNIDVIISTFHYKEEIKNFLIENAWEKEKIYLSDVILSFLPNNQYTGLDVQNQYFDECVHFGENEVFLDIGVLNGDSSFLFSKHCPNYKQIYLFEPTKKSYEKAEKLLKSRGVERFELFNVGIYSEKTTLNFLDDDTMPESNQISENGTITIHVDTLDHFFLHNSTKNLLPPTFIKMDIEGAELAALKGGAKTIKKYKPKLAISMYHKPEDMIEIPAYILSLVPEYKLYLRHYSTNDCETVLYAVMDESNA